MSDAMVTGRMSAEKKKQGLRILQQDGITASQAVNLMFDRMISDGSAAFLLKEPPLKDGSQWQTAAKFIDAIPQERKTRFDSMTKQQIREERLKSRGLR